jgi:hypothetical protein
MKAAIVIGWEECLITRVQMKTLGIITDNDKKISLLSKESHTFKEIARALVAEYPTCSKSIRDAVDELVQALDDPNYILGLIESYHRSIKEQVIGRRR